MRRGDHVVEGQQRVIGRRRFVQKYVNVRTSDNFIVQRRDQIFFFVYPTARWSNTVQDDTPLTVYYL